MALNLIVAPTPVAPAGLADYVAQNNLIEAGSLNTEQPLRVISGDIPESTVLQIGGAIYRADSDTAITGGASDYVKVTPAGATASAAYVADLTGVTWNKTYNGYYDVSGNLYVFNESKALYNGEIAAIQTRYLNIEEDGNIYIGANLFLGSGSADRNIQFASDANILWDESEDEFLFDKDIKINAPEKFNGAHLPNLLSGSVNNAQLWAFISPHIPTIGNQVVLHGVLYLFSLANPVVYAQRTSSIAIDIYYMKDGVAVIQSKQITNAAGATTVVLLSW